MSKFYSRWKRPLIRSKILSGLSKYPRYIRDMFKYSRMEGAEKITIRDSYPCLFDKTNKTEVDSHYFYQGLWAFRNIYEHKPQFHVDVGSSVSYIGFLTAITKVIFVDIRPLDVSNVDNLECVKGNILDMPYEDNSIKSLSCLHVAEHIGLGRYGDQLNPFGTKKAATELSRCLAKGGNLFFSLPVGQPRVCFNAHRVHDPRTILEYFDGLELVEFSCSDDEKKFIVNADIETMKNARFACGMFWFTKK